MAILSRDMMLDLGTIAVTGATGFLGGHLCERLAKEGRRLRILARDQDKARRFEERGDAVFVGDITDRNVLDRLVDGCDAVVHLVSNFRVVKGTPESYRSTNVEGTVQALEAARRAGVRRFVHCSTIGVHGHVAHTPADESAPFNPGDLYQETKLEAERACHAAVGAGMEIVIIRPTSQYGPGDMRMLKMFRLLAKRKFLLIGPCTANFHAVYVDDLVEGFWLALNHPGIDGEVFLIGGERYLPLRDYIQAAARAVDAPPPSIRLPYAPVNLAAIACETVCRPFKIEPPLHRRRLRFFWNNRAFDISKAQRVLGFAPRVELEEGMRRTVEWYRAQGWL